MGDRAGPGASEILSAIYLRRPGRTGSGHSFFSSDITDATSTGLRSVIAKNLRPKPPNEVPIDFPSDLSLITNRS